MWIVFEGNDGSGKTTITRWIANHFKEDLKLHNFTTFETFEPGAGDKNCPIKKQFLTKKHLSYQKKLLLLLVSRYENISKITEKLSTKHIVLCDRYHYSNVIYQGCLIEYSSYKFSEQLAPLITMRSLLRLNHLLFNFKTPDIVFFLLADPRVALSRMNRSSCNFIDEMPLTYHSKIYKCYKALFLYLSLMPENPHIRYHLIDSTRSFQLVYRDVKKIVDKYLRTHWQYSTI